jgi:hypothetical protein
MTFPEVLRRITGISTPIFGISWEPTDSERAIARKVVAYLEDRRVLFTPFELEDPNHCVQSILQIRKFLTERLGELDSHDELRSALGGMRAACRKFLDAAGGSPRRARPRDPWHWHPFEFNTALGELRGVFGIQLARILALHGLDVEDDLATVLPAEDSDDTV